MKLRLKEIQGLVQDPIASGSVVCRLDSLDRSEGRVSRIDLYDIPAEPAWMTLYLFLAYKTFLFLD